MIYETLIEARRGQMKIFHKKYTHTPFKKKRKSK